jgi:hypothetical protein
MNMDLALPIADGINDDGSVTYQYLSTTSGLHGYMVVMVTETNDLGEIYTEDQERVKDSMYTYQFATEEEAIADFDKWAGDAFDEIPRKWRNPTSGL